MPLQTLAELWEVLTRKGGYGAAETAARVADWRRLARVVAADEEIFAGAAQLAVDHGFGIFDAIILATAASAECGLLLSEDLQDGFSWRGVTVRDPLGADPPPAVARLFGRAENST